MKYAILDGINVVNLIEYETQPIAPIEGLNPNYIAIPTTSAGVGYTYINGVFISPKPFASWTLINNVWQPPVAMPIDDNMYSWNEQTLSWDIVE